MTSTFTWLDYSDHERKRALAIVDALRQEDTRDELGLGVIRDALSDRLFPGTSTIQTRVRYFLFLPWIFRELERKDLDAARFAPRLRHLQDRLRRALVEGGESRGVIGFRRAGDVKRLPSSVYWQGLRRWRILRFDGSEYEYARASRQLAARPVLRDNDGGVVSGTDVALFDSDLPRAPDGWLTCTTFSLRPDESRYLQGRIERAASESLLTHLLHTGIVPPQTAFVWDAVTLDTLPAALRDEVTHARNFSEAMHGAALLYNLMLAEAKALEPRAEEYRTALGEWWQVWTARRTEIQTWSRQRFWMQLALWGARIGPATRDFVDTWLDAIAASTRVDTVIKDSSLRRLISEREGLLKGPRARLGNAEALRAWNGASGTAQLDFRWRSPVRGMLRDLLTPSGESRLARAG